MNPASVAVTGASGQIGYFLLPRLTGAHESVVALARRTPAWRQNPAVTWQSVDLRAGWPQGLAVERLVHAGPLGLLPGLIPTAADLGLQRLIAFSSTSAVIKADSRHDAERRQAQALLRAEEEVIAACEAKRVGWTLFRPTLIYGAGLDRNLSALAGLIRRWGIVPLPGPARGLRQPVHADDLALACMQALDRPETERRRYDLGGGTTLAYGEMVEAVFGALGRQARIWTVPSALCRLGLWGLRLWPAYRQLGPGLLRRLERDQVVDHGPAARDFGYAPRPFVPGAACFRPPE